jgi:hypothetical protein
MDEAIAEYHARHPQTPASVKKARDPLLEEQATTIFGDGRYPGSPYDTAVNAAIILYSSGWWIGNNLMPEDKRVPWDRYPQAIWKKAIARCEQRKPPRAMSPDKPVPLGSIIKIR